MVNISGQYLYMIKIKKKEQPFVLVWSGLHHLSFSISHTRPERLWSPWHLQTTNSSVKGKCHTIFSLNINITHYIKTRSVSPRPRPRPRADRPQLNVFRYPNVALTFPTRSPINIHLKAPPAPELWFIYELLYMGLLSTLKEQYVMFRAICCLWGELQ